ncbi:hypothetical protein [Chryseobacterium sp.]|uniref:hypothetical protein n=1 Tax=Chryseobacterium sp. TaxID=1871047 RepID=UPI0025C4CA7B|nr:hypothetical protein [Chryseobacterium sp.]MBV8326815.1 hypothetical protein [Chryseobacterium sp.]
MSIFPKRTIPGKTVTIHWAIALESEKNIPQFPLIRLGVQSPDGSIVSLCDQHIMLLPEPKKEQREKKEIRMSNNLPRNTPLLILADYLSGKKKKEKLVEMLKHIHFSRHFYFQYSLAEDALPGKYKLISEIYLEGECYTSRTAEEDFFYVDKIRTTYDNGKIRIHNLSPEICPVKIISCSQALAVNNIYDIQPMESIQVSDHPETQYLLYNEERETILLTRGNTNRILRNQTLQNFEKIENGSLKIYVLFPENDDAFTLEENYARIWQMADGTLNGNTLKNIDQEAFNSMMEAHLIYEYDIRK